MKRSAVVMVVALIALIACVGFNLLTPGTARAQATGDCAQAPTIDSLETCVENAASLGHITSQGVTHSLLAKLDAAEEALEHGQTTKAINKLEAFIDEVQAQAGKHIIPVHAQHLVMHAQIAIQSLENG